MRFTVHCTWRTARGARSSSCAANPGHGCSGQWGRGLVSEWEELIAIQPGNVMATRYCFVFSLQRRCRFKMNDETIANSPLLSSPRSPFPYTTPYLSPSNSLSTSPSSSPSPSPSPQVSVTQLHSCRYITHVGITWTADDVIQRQSVPGNPPPPPYPGTSVSSLCHTSLPATRNAHVKYTYQS